MIELVDISDKHKDSLIRLLNNNEVEQWLAGPPYPYTEKDADEFIQRCKQESNPPEYRFAIELDGIHIGGIGLHTMSDNTGWIGYYIDNEYWNRGFGTKAVKKILELAFGKLKLKTVYAYTFEGNTASQKLLLKLGFTEKHNPKVFTKNGKSYNSKYFIKENTDK